MDSCYHGNTCYHAWSLYKGGGGGYGINGIKVLQNLENFRAESFSIRTSRIESSRFRAHVVKGRPAFRDRVTQHLSDSDICPTHVTKKTSTTSVRNCDLISIRHISNSRHDLNCYLLIVKRNIFQFEV